MSRLGDLESALITRLEGATISGSPAFIQIRGLSGGWRPALREVLRRERTPAAYVGFLEDPTAPEVKSAVRGAKFAIFVVESVLREDADPRHGDISNRGAFALLDAVRARLDDYEIVEGFRLTNLHEKFLDADDRSTVYESLYRVWPIVESEPEFLHFAGDPIAGTHSLMTMEVGPIGADSAEFTYHGISGLYKKALSTSIRTILWKGTLRATTHAGLNDIEGVIESHIQSETFSDIDEGNERVLVDCTLIAFFRRNGRRHEGGFVVQDAELLFTQAL